MREEYYYLLEERERRLSEEKYKYFIPHKWQEEIIRATNDYREIMMSKGNRVGGTLLTMFCAWLWSCGWYDKIGFQWNGRRFEYPTRGLIIGYSADQLRGATQKILMGEGKPWGTGHINNCYPIMPKELADKCDIMMSRQNSGCIDFIRVPFLTGGLSTILMMTQNQDFGTIMGDEFDWVIYDEFIYKPLLYSQVRTRTFDRKGIIMIPGTPERRDGKPPDQKTIERFSLVKPKTNKGKDITYYREVSLYEAEHFTKEEIDDIISSMEDWEKPYRIYGKPVYGDQLVFKYIIEHQEDIEFDPKDIPDYKECRHIIGLDWGMSDFGAIVWCMVDGYGKHWIWNYEKIRNLNPIQVAGIIRSYDNMIGFNTGIPVVCGRDVGKELPSRSDKPISITEMMLEQGVNMYPKAAYNAFTKGKNNFIEPGIYHICQLAQQKKLYISTAPHMKNLWNEILTCYFREGKIPKRNEMRFDGIEALRYACIMSVYAQMHPDNVVSRIYGNKHKRAKTSYSIYN